MKKLIPLLMLALVASVSLAQTVNVQKVVLSTLDTAKITTTTPQPVITQGAPTVAIQILKYNAPVVVTTPPVTTPPVVIVPSNGKRFKYAYHAAITLSNQSNQTISGDSITASGGMFLNGCHDIHITKNYINNSGAACIHLSNCYNITIDSNFIGNGNRIIYAESCPNGGIQVNNNQLLNPLGPVSVSGSGQFVQFDNVYTANVQNTIMNNKMESLPGAGKPEDAISLYESKGTAVLPILVTGNMIRGGGPSTSGGGIMTGDEGGSYEYVANNILVNPGQYGLSISGGDHISLVNNQCYAAKAAFTNVGLYVWTQDKAPTSSNCTVSGNRVYWINSAGTANSDWLSSGTDPTPTGWNTNIWNDATLNPNSMIPTTIITWK